MIVVQLPLYQLTTGLGDPVTLQDNLTVCPNLVVQSPSSTSKWGAPNQTHIHTTIYTGWQNATPHMKLTGLPWNRSSFIVLIQLINNMCIILKTEHGMAYLSTKSQSWELRAESWEVTHCGRRGCFAAAGPSGPWARTVWGGRSAPAGWSCARCRGARATAPRHARLSPRPPSPQCHPAE